MLYERGDLVGQLAFADLKKQALINEKAKAADHEADFSRRIRDGVIGLRHYAPWKTRDAIDTENGL